MEDPRQMSPGSIMPSYSWLLKDNLDTSTTAAKINALRAVGVPYEKGYENYANKDLVNQANVIATDLTKNGIPADPDKEIIALIAYLQRLGTDIKVNQTAGAK